MPRDIDDNMFLFFFRRNFLVLQLQLQCMCIICIKYYIIQNGAFFYNGAFFRCYFFRFIGCYGITPESTHTLYIIHNTYNKIVMARNILCGLLYNMYIRKTTATRYERKKCGLFNSISL